MGKGERLKDILESTTEVAEGVETAMALAKLIKKSDKSFRSDLKYPIIFMSGDGGSTAVFMVDQGIHRHAIFKIAGKVVGEHTGYNESCEL